MNSFQNFGYAAILGITTATEIVLPFVSEEKLKIEPDVPQQRYEFRIPAPSVAGYADTTFVFLGNRYNPSLIGSDTGRTVTLNPSA